MSQTKVKPTYPAGLEAKEELTAEKLSASGLVTFASAVMVIPNGANTSVSIIPQNAVKFDGGVLKRYTGSAWENVVTELITGDSDGAFSILDQSGKTLPYVQDSLMTGAPNIQLGDGTLAAPALSFATRNVGLYATSTQMLVGVAGSKKVEVNASGLSVTGAVSASGTFSSQYLTSNATSTAVSNDLVVSGNIVLPQKASTTTNWSLYYDTATTFTTLINGGTAKAIAMEWVESRDSDGEVAVHGETYKVPTYDAATTTVLECIDRYKGSDGTAAAPTFAMSNGTTGLYGSATQLNFSVAGTAYGYVSSAGLNITGAVVASGAVTATGSVGSGDDLTATNNLVIGGVTMTPQNLTDLLALIA